METIKEFPVADALDMLRELSSSTLVHVANKSAYVCGMMKTYKQRKAAGGVVHGHGHVAEAAKKTGPDDSKMKVGIGELLFIVFALA